MSAHTHAGPNSQLVMHNHRHGDVRHDHDSLKPFHVWAWQAPKAAGEKFYAVRQARTKVIGSRIMTRGEAAREVTVWRAEIGPAAMVPDSPEVRRAVHTDDQETLGRLLADGQNNPTD